MEKGTILALTTMGSWDDITLDCAPSAFALNTGWFSCWHLIGWISWATNRNQSPAHAETQSPGTECVCAASVLSAPSLTLCTSNSCPTKSSHYFFKTLHINRADLRRKQNYGLISYKVWVSPVCSGCSHIGCLYQAQVRSDPNIQFVWPRLYLAGLSLTSLLVQVLQLSLLSVFTKLWTDWNGKNGNFWKWPSEWDFSEMPFCHCCAKGELEFSVGTLTLRSALHGPAQTWQQQQQ